MTTQIHFVLDRSGSMNTIVNDTIGGYNSFVNSQKKETTDGKCTMSLYQFDHEFETVYENMDIKEVPPLDTKTFVPRGSTALLDAMGTVIRNVGDIDGKGILVFLTDGEENASSKFTKEHIFDLIKAKEKEGWAVVFLGAN